MVNCPSIINDDKLCFMITSRRSPIVHGGESSRFVPIGTLCLELSAVNHYVGLLFKERCDYCEHVLSVTSG